MRKLIADAWWGVEKGKKKMHGVHTNDFRIKNILVVLALGISKLFNQAMLGCQGWRFLTEPKNYMQRQRVVIFLSLVLGMLGNTWCSILLHLV
jgi:hypothetical protein